MPDPNPSEPTERHVRCRNLVWESSPDDGGSIPGRYCVSRLGTIQMMDCPVFQGQSCCLFDPREDGEDPEVAGEERILEIRGELTADYLRWIYWKRIDTLRGHEAPPLAEEAPAATEELPAEVEADSEAEEIVQHEIPPPKEEALKEKYPGQRRSEDRRRSRAPVDPEDAAAEEDDFTAGIFDLPALDPEPDPPASEEAPPAPPPAEATPGGDKTSADTEKKRHPNRRGRRRRGRRRGRGSSNRKPSN